MNFCQHAKIITLTFPVGQRAPLLFNSHNVFMPFFTLVFLVLSGYKFFINELFRVSLQRALARQAPVALDYQSASEVKNKINRGRKRQ